MSAVLSTPVEVNVPPSVINTEDFFRQKNIWRSNEFWQKIGRHISKKVRANEINLKRRILKQDAHDSQIRKKLPPNHVFTPDDFFVYASILINQCPDGENEGVLNHHNNLFYVQVGDKILVAHISWRSRGQQWHFLVDEPDEFINCWPTGSYVFSRN